MDRALAYRLDNILEYLRFCTRCFRAMEPWWAHWVMNSECVVCGRFASVSSCQQCTYSDLRERQPFTRCSGIYITLRSEELTAIALHDALWKEFVVPFNRFYGEKESGNLAMTHWHDGRDVLVIWFDTPEMMLRNKEREQVVSLQSNAEVHPFDNLYQGESGKVGFGGAKTYAFSKDGKLISAAHRTTPWISITRL